jgi:tetratricopeptide (TPR) repeat protein
VIHSRIGDAARAEQYYRRSIEADSSNTLAYGNLLIALVRQGKFEEAESALALFGARFPGNLRQTESRAQLASSRGDYDTAERIFAALRDSLPANLGVRTATTHSLSHLAAVRGRLNDARSRLSELISLYAGRDQPDQSLVYSLDAAALDVYARGRPADAVARVDEALQRYPLGELHPLERPYARLIGIYADAGEPARARALLDEYDTTVSPRLRAWNEREIFRVAHASLMRAEGDPHAAADSATVWLRSSACGRCLLPTLGRALEAAGRADSAIVVYERYIEEPSAQRTALLDWWYLGPVLERVAQLHDQRGDAQRAARFYARFVELWQNADPELQPRVGAARARLEQLTRTRG